MRVSARRESGQGISSLSEIHPWATHDASHEQESRILSVSDIYSIVGERWKVVEYLAAVYHCCALERRVLEVIYRPSAAYLWAALRTGY